MPCCTVADEGVTMATLVFMEEHDSQVGRPRSEDADARILNAAIQLYGDAGWSGYNFTKLAQLAGVGKSSLYARWCNKDELLIDAFHFLVPVPTPTGTTVWDILSTWASFRVSMYVGPQSQAIRRVFVEMSTGEPAIAAIHDYLYTTPIDALQTRLWEFKAHGYLPSQMSVTRLVDAIEGSVLMRGYSIPPENVHCFLTEIPEYVETLVADQLRAPLRAPEIRLARIAS
jgi:AcrR family transcriptional regulator